VGLNLRRLAALLLVSVTITSALPFTGQAAPSPNEAEVLQLKSSSATFNDAFQVYECFVDEFVRFDFTVLTGWDIGRVTRVRFIATMAPIFQKRMDISNETNVPDPRLAGLKYLADSELVSNSYEVDISSLSAGELVGKSSVSVTYHFNTAGTWKVYYVYEVSGSGYCGEDGEEAVIRVKGHPSSMSSVSSTITVLLALPVATQLLLHLKRKFHRKKPSEDA